MRNHFVSFCFRSMSPSFEFCLSLSLSHSLALFRVLSLSVSLPVSLPVSLFVSLSVSLAVSFSDYLSIVYLFFSLFNFVYRSYPSIKGQINKAF
ncbi:hypothetical protein GLYMA_19G064300v4 [Glycine max]|uniref:Uncharacterized protein n=1 Tax=Glycine max TaxID=3847 RepID=A0A0R0EJE8_SOYBN|nr:hypothetical protein GYH30_052259 [Glycine max]KRG94128.1 hypothetical protein GLYMA_19G064300v4 [Glycine max]